MAFTLHPTLAKDSILAAKVGSLQVRLVDDARFFWLLVVPETTATELHDLDEKTAESLWKLTRRLGKALQAHCDADKTLNPSHFLRSVLLLLFLCPYKQV